ncbi:RNA polymerase sigma factor [Spirochaetota bacterium]
MMSNEHTLNTEAQKADEQNITRFLKGDEAGFDNLVLKYQDRVYNMCLRYFNNTADAEDAAQETFVKVYRYIGKFQFRSSFSTWLYRIAMNTCKNRSASSEYRKAKTGVSIDKTNEEDRPVIRLSSSSSVEKEVERKDRLRGILDELERMPHEMKQLIVLADIQELHYGEVAGITKMKLGTVKSRLSKARTMLSKRVKGREAYGA